MLRCTKLICLTSSLTCLADPGRNEQIVTEWQENPMAGNNMVAATSGKPEAISTRASHTHKLFYFNSEKFFFPHVESFSLLYLPSIVLNEIKPSVVENCSPSYFPGESERVCLGWKHRDQSYWVWGGQRQGPRYKNQTLDYQCFSPFLANARNHVLGWKSQIAISLLGHQAVFSSAQFHQPQQHCSLQNCSPETALDRTAEGRAAPPGQSSHPCSWAGWMEGPSLLCNRAELDALWFYILFAWQDHHLLLQTLLGLVVFSPRTVPGLGGTEMRWKVLCKSPKSSLKVAQEPAQSQALELWGKATNKHRELNMGGEHSMGHLCYSCPISKVDAANICTFNKDMPKTEELVRAAAIHQKTPHCPNHCFLKGSADWAQRYIQQHLLGSLSSACKEAECPRAKPSITWHLGYTKSSKSRLRV